MGFWFPGSGITPDDLPPEMADYYLYDLEKTEDGYRPKCVSEAASEDSASVSSQAPTLDEMRDIQCPVALVRASEGCFPGSRPLIPDTTLEAMSEALGIQQEILVKGANHYTLLLPEFTSAWTDILTEDGPFQ